MTRLFYTTIMAVGLLSAVPEANAGNGTSGLSGNGLALTENKGQITDQDLRPRQDIDFSIHAAGISMFGGSGHLHYQFASPAPDQAREVYRLDMELVGANKNVRPVKENPRPGFENYFLSHTGSAGVTGVRSYGRIVYPGVYPGIDWVVYVQGQELKYDFILHEGADVRDIRIRYTGMTDAGMPEGGLMIHTPFGNIREEAPVAWTQQDRLPVASAFVQKGANEWGFEVAPYKGVLVLDPLLQWGTYFGGSNDEGGSVNVAKGSSVTAGSDRMVYLTSTTLSNNIATSGAHQQVLGGGEDVVVAKFHPDGSLLWATYYGGNNEDRAWDIAADRIGHVYIAGSTLSQTGISKNGFRNNYNTNVNVSSGNNYLAQFNAANGQLVWATYYAGGHPTALFDLEGSVAVDRDNNVYLAGTTGQDTGVHTSGAHQEVIGAATGSAFLVKFDTAGNRLWGTYYGGYSSAGPATRGFAVVADGAGNIYLAGNTYALDSIATPGTHKPAFTGGTGNDIFIAKFSASGQRIWGTYYGGTGSEGVSTGDGLAVDRNGNLYITGLTQSPDNPGGIHTSGTSRVTASLSGFCGLGGCQDAFMAKFDSSGQLLWGTYTGPVKLNYPYGVAVDGAGNPWIAGAAGYLTSDATFTPTPDAYQTVYGGAGDAVLFRYHADSGTLKYSSFYGGSDLDIGRSIAFDEHGVMYLLGTTRSTQGIATATSNVFHRFLEGGGDVFLTKFISLAVGNADTAVCAGTPFLVPYTPPTEYNPGNIFTVELSDITGDFTNAVVIGTDASNTTSPIECMIPAGTPAGSGYMIRIQSTAPQLTSEAVALTVSHLDVPVEISVDVYTLGTTAPYVTYQWYKGGELIPGATDSTYEVTENNTYTVKVKDQNGCVDSSDAYVVTNIGIRDLHPAAAAIYPNPATDVLYINAPSPLLFSIAALDGRYVVPVSGIRKGRNAISVAGLAPGIYVIRMMDEAGRLQQVERFMKADRKD